ncbi:UDP-N-acetylmuramoyl-L-alanine--D-glutamate ligase [Candidatus Saccharibacteria bacterium]|nr:UDP-N-acetylmuramoyl-L-alanine--D-glutamate ligase [Candidatus Saccharibacteria bacterium]
MKIAIVGFDREGRASYDYFSARGHSIAVFDQNPNVVLPKDVSSVLGDSYLQTLQNYDLVVRTPSLHPSQLLAAHVQNDKIWSGTNEFFKVCPTKNIIGVTGTKGKGTTSSLITKMLEKAGKTVWLGGNIGIPALDMLKNDIKPDDWVVLELSNFQLIDLQSSPHIAVCLMVVPEHLDWHKDFIEYTDAKRNLFAHQDNKDIAIYFAENETSKAIASAGDGKKISYYSDVGAYIKDNAVVINGHRICTVDEIALLGKHNWQNVCAAVTAVWQVTQDVSAIAKAIKEFTGLQHRIEYVGEKNGIKFYNDSFATGLHATKAALSAIEGPKIAIIGGYDRMLDIDEFGVFLRDEAKDIKQILLIGDSQNRVATMLSGAGLHNYTQSDANNMKQIVAEAVKLADAGDAIVLSPGFASFGLFSNFEERGTLFKKEVAKL